MSIQNLAYQDEIYDELIDGKIVMMTPRPNINHYQISSNIEKIFSNHLKNKLCRAFADGVDLYLSENDRFIPDGMVVCDRSKIKRRGIYGAPDLVVEVLSPSTARYDRGKKKDAYERAGVREYWIVNPEERSVEVYLLKNDRYILDNIYRIYPDYELEDMTEEEKAEIVMEFKCGIFDDLNIKLEDIFDNMI